MPKVSIIVPVYNTEKYLEKCLNSLVNQSLEDIEIIIVNDGSTDNSENIILEYVKGYPNKIKYLKKENTGIAETRNLGVENVAGEYFIFVDADDYIENVLIERLVNCIVDEKIDLVKYKMTIVKENEEQKINGPVFEIKSGEEAFNKLCFDDILIDTPCLYLFNAKFYKDNNFKFLKDTYHEDFGLIPIVLLQAKNMLSIDFYGYYYVQADNSITRNEDYSKTVKRANDLLLHYDNMIKQIEKISLSQKTINNIKQYYSNSILEMAKKIQKEEQNKYILEIKNRKLIKNIRVKSIKSLLKKLILFLNIRLYLKLK